MNCPNCGSTINQGEKFCGVCGTQVAEENTQVVQPQVQPQVVTEQPVTETVQVEQPQVVAENVQPQVVAQEPTAVAAQVVQPQQTYTAPVNPAPAGANDSVLLTAYLGKNGEKFVSKKFNWAAFFFGPAYLAYRKFLPYAAILVCVNLLFNNILKLESIGSIILLAIDIVIGFMFNGKYVEYAKQDIEKVKAANPNMSSDQLTVACAQKGGTAGINILYIFLIALGLSLVVSVLGF